MTELSLCFGLILIILYGLFSMTVTENASPVSLAGDHLLVPGKNLYSSRPALAEKGALSGPSRPFPFFVVVEKGITSNSSAVSCNLHLSDVYFFSRLWPVMLLLGYAIDFPWFDCYLPVNATVTDISIAMLPDGEASERGLLSWPTGLALAFQSNGIDVLLVLLTIVIMQSFKSFESVLLLLLAFVGQLFMLHSCDLVSFYICLEAQNFCFLVLCGLQPRIFKYSTSRGSRPLAGVEASIKYLLLSAFSSGVLLFWFSILYLRTGITALPSLAMSMSASPAATGLASWGSFAPQSPDGAMQPIDTFAGVATSISFSGNLLARPLDALKAVQPDQAMLGGAEDVVPQMLILIALMFKLGGAPLHIWMIDIYSGVKRQLLMYLSTAPKLSLFGFWINSWHSVWTDLSVFLFVALSMIIGCFGAYNQPTLRALFAYSTINEIGLMLMAIETAGFHSLFQHLSIYIITMLLLWNNTDKRFFSILAVSLAGLPPLAGFFGKAWIFQSVANSSTAGPYLGLLFISLFCTGLSLVYYLRVFRLFTLTPAAQVCCVQSSGQGTMGVSVDHKNIVYPAGVDGNVGMTHHMGIETRTYGAAMLDTQISLVSFCVIFLLFAPLFYIKPFVL